MRGHKVTECVSFPFTSSSPPPPAWIRLRSVAIGEDLHRVIVIKFWIFNVSFFMLQVGYVSNKITCSLPHMWCGVVCCAAQVHIFTGQRLLLKSEPELLLHRHNNISADLGPGWLDGSVAPWLAGCLLAWLDGFYSYRVRTYMLSRKRRTRNDTWLIHGTYFRLYLRTCFDGMYNFIIKRGGGRGSVCGYCEAKEELWLDQEQNESHWKVEWAPHKSTCNGFCT